MHTLPTDQAHRDIAIDPRQSVLVRAPAGSGKTGVLLLRYLNCLLTVENPEQIVAITFTNKAAGEIKERVVDALQAGENLAPETPFDAAISGAVVKVLARDAERGWQLSRNPNRLRISTFDSFCASIAKRLPLMSGMGAARPITDNLALYREAIIDLFQEIDNPNCPADLKAALERLLAYGSNRIETLIPLLSALMGKRDQWVSDVMGADIEAMNDALALMVEDQFAAIEPVLHECNIAEAIAAFVESSSSTQEHAWAAEFDLSRPISTSDLPLLSTLAQHLINGDGNLYSPRSVRYALFQPKQPATEAMKAWLQSRVDNGQVELISNAFSTLSVLPAPHLPAYSEALVEDFFCALRYLLAYQRLVFDRRGGVDFTEIAQRAIYALSQQDQISDAVLQEDRIAHILVDEMQDTSVSQINLLRNLCQDWEPDDGRSVFFCGDVQQSIYAFRGSLVSLFDQLTDQGRFANRPLRQLQLTANFRSSPFLVNWVNDSFATLFTSKGKSYTPAVPQRTTEGGVVVHPYVQGEGVKARRQVAELEACSIVEEIQRVQASDQQTGRVSRIAILARYRTHLAKIIDALKQANIPFSGQDIDTLEQTAPVLDLTALLRALWHEADNVAWARLLRAPFVGLRWEDLRLLRLQGGTLREAVFGSLPDNLSDEGRDSLRQLVDTLSWVEGEAQAADIRWLLRTTWHKLGGPACVNSEEHRDILRVFAVLDEHAPAGVIEDIAALERALSKLYATPPATDIELMTIHKSKGLEFDVVFLPGLGGQATKDDSPLLVWQHLNDHLLIAPKPQTADPEAERYYQYLDKLRREALRDEYDRQLYVALTRAKRVMHLYGMATMSKKGDLKADSTSFLGRLWPIIGAEFEAAPALEESDNTGNWVEINGARLTNLQIGVRQDYRPEMLKISPLQNLQRLSENSVIEDNIEQRAVGIVFHEIMERMGKAGVEAVPTQEQEGLVARVRARLRHHCHPEPGLNASVDRVIDLVRSTLECEHGRWILGSYQWSASEQTLRRLIGGDWETLVLDRAFIESSPAGDTCWIIDYKSAHATGPIDQFLKSQEERYAPKMQAYRTALKATGVNCPINTALYFPAHKKLLITGRSA